MMMRQCRIGHTLQTPHRDLLVAVSKPGLHKRIDSVTGIAKTKLEKARRSYVAAKVLAPNQPATYFARTYTAAVPLMS